jgi:hypothetical protein
MQPCLIAIYPGICLDDQEKTLVRIASPAGFEPEIFRINIQHLTTELLSLHTDKSYSINLPLLGNLNTVNPF